MAPFLILMSMMVQANGESVIQKSSHILLVSVTSASAGEWRPAPRRLKTRTVELRVRIERELKGKAAPNEATIQISQTEPATPMITSVPGVWSGKPIDTATRYVVFSNSPSARSSDVLAESATLRVVAAKDALADAELAISADGHKWSLDETLEHAGTKAVGSIFTEYATSRIGEVLFSDPAEFDRVLKVLEKPGVDNRFRLAMMEKIYGKFLLGDAAPPALVTSLVISTFRIARLPDGKALDDRLLGVLLPHLAGIQGGGSKRSATEVFRNHPGDLENAKKVLASHPEAGPLLRWLSE